MKFSPLLVSVGVAVFAGPALSEDLPAVDAPYLSINVEPEPVLMDCSLLIAQAAVVPTGFGDVHQAIDAMRTMMTEPGGLAQSTAVTAAADAYAQHWDIVVAGHVEQQELSMTAMIDGMLDQNSDTIDAFLTIPPMDPGPSLFLDHEFQVTMAPFERVGGFFAP